MLIDPSGIFDRTFSVLVAVGANPVADEAP